MGTRRGRRGDASTRLTADALTPAFAGYAIFGATLGYSGNAQAEYAFSLKKPNFAPIPTLQ